MVKGVFCDGQASVDDDYDDDDETTRLKEVFLEDGMERREG